VRWERDAYVSEIDGEPLIVLGADIHEAQRRADAAVLARHPHVCDGSCGEWKSEPCGFLSEWPTFGGLTRPAAVK
jgi:hypothetical protein